MKKYKLIRIYETLAESQGDAWKIFRGVEDAGNLTELLCSEFVKEKEQGGFMNQVKKQIKG